MATLTLSDQQARSLYPGASAEFKTILEASFGKEFFSQKITDRVKTFEDACTVLGIKTPTYNADVLSPDEAAYMQLKIVVKALNEGWEPDWDDEDEYKWYPWFYMNSSRGFSVYDVHCYFTGSLVGSRLCFRSEELAQYASKQFLDIYKAFFTL